MKMSTMNISLPPAMSEYVRRATERDYGNASEFFRDLVRQRIQKEVKADVAFLDKAMKGAPAGPTESEIEEVLAIQRRVGKALRARGV